MTGRGDAHPGECRSRSATHTFDKDYWDRHWQGERDGAPGDAPVSEPNPHLVREVDEITPGTALDAGCGTGAEATWLASRGWRVTGVDLAGAALDGAVGRAAASGVADRVRWLQADLSAWEPDTAYDLVTTHYAHPAMPQLEFYDRIASWVAPGGTLLVVGHLHGHGAEHGTGAHETPASASVTVTTVTERLEPAEWDVVTAEERHHARPGHGHGTVRLHDVVVRALRRR